MGNVYGYVSVSSKDQNEDRQIITRREMKVPDENIYVDKQSGKDFNRTQYKKNITKDRKVDLYVLDKPTLIIAHNKTLAAQLYGEFKEFFPENAVEYFVSYYVFWLFGRIASS